MVVVTYPPCEYSNRIPPKESRCFTYQPANPPAWCPACVAIVRNAAEALAGEIPGVRS